MKDFCVFDKFCDFHDSEEKTIGQSKFTPGRREARFGIFVIFEIFALAGNAENAENAEYAENGESGPPPGVACEKTYKMADQSRPPIFCFLWEIH